MTSYKFNCEHCLYKSNKKFNLNRHMVSKHTNIEIRNVEDNVLNDVRNVEEHIFNVRNIEDNVLNDFRNVEDCIYDDKNIDDDKKCLKCGKILSSKNYLQKHLKICKGVLNPLECHKCHKIFASTSSKSHHLKICKGIINDIVVCNKETNELILSDVLSNTSNEITINNTTNNIINNTINDNTVNNTIININLVCYNKDEETISFDISHLDKNILYKITTRHFDSGFYFFCMKLFENKNNQLIVKTSLKLSYSKIHTTSKEWIKTCDKYIYPIIMTNISETMLLFIDKNKNTSTTFKNLIAYLDIMATNGYSASKTAEFKSIYGNHMNKLKILFNTFLV